MQRDVKYSPKALEKQRIRDLIYQRRRRTENPEWKSADSKEYDENNREKKNAHQKVFQAIKKGLLVKCGCEICGKEKAQAHHSNYYEPLKVKWLCPSHHKKEHLLINS